jgi:hypothetical protein
MGLTRKLPSSISNIQQSSELHSIKRLVNEVNTNVSQDIIFERGSDYTHPNDNISLSLPNKKKIKVDHDKDYQQKKNCIIVLTDPILDEAADEVAEELEWEVILQQWNVDCERFVTLSPHPSTEVCI